MQLLSFTMNNVDYGIALKDVESIESRMNVVNVPTAPAHIKGIARLHGVIIPVFSLASRFGIPNREIQNMIVVNVNGMKVGLEVEKVKEIVDVEDSNVVAMPIIMNGVKNCFNDVASCQKELIVMLDVGSLVSVEEQEEIRKLIDDNGEA